MTVVLLQLYWEMINFLTLFATIDKMMTQSGALVDRLYSCGAAAGVLETIQGVS
jgi:hypothetical protein